MQHVQADSGLFDHLARLVATAQSETVSLLNLISLVAPIEATENAWDVQNGTVSPNWSDYSRAMITHILGRISKLDPIMGSLVASAIGCFVFTPAFRMVAMDDEGSDGDLPIRADDRSPGPSIGIGAAIFLMIFIASEALATIAALRH